VLVGTGQEPLTVHERLIRNSSTFFEKVLTKPSKELSRRRVSLGKEDPDIFKAYIHWLYRNSISVPNRELSGHFDDGYLFLVKTYVLGNRLLDVNFQNAIIDAIWERYMSGDPEDGMSLGPGASPTTYAYKNTSERSPLRRLLVDICVHDQCCEWIDDKTESYTKAFLHDAATGLAYQRNHGPPEDLTLANYYAN
jgi:hypothetical protein